LLDVDTVVICAGQEPQRELVAGLVAARIPHQLIGGADVAVELDAKRAIEQGTQILRERRGLRFDQPNNFAIRTPDRMIRIFKSVTSGVSAAVVVIAGISLVIGGVGVMNIMLMNVTQRTREIGIRKAVGARRRDILQQFLTEAVTLSLVGGVAGVLTGLGIAFLIGKVSPLPASFSPWAVASGLIMATLVGLFFGTYPAWRAARLDPIDALRYE